MKRDIKALRAKYKAGQNPAIEEINRKERERSHKARLLGMEHGRMGRYDPPYDVIRDHSAKLAYDLGYLSTAKKV